MNNGKIEKENEQSEFSSHEEEVSPRDPGRRPSRAHDATTRTHGAALAPLRPILTHLLRAALASTCHPLEKLAFLFSLRENST